METFSKILFGVFLATVVWGFIYAVDKADVANKYQVRCVDATGKVVYSDNSRFYPTVYQRNGRLTCIVKGID